MAEKVFSLKKTMSKKMFKELKPKKGTYIYIFYQNR